MRKRVLLGVLLVLVAAGAAVAYSFLTPKRYDATARVVVHPVSGDDKSFAGIDVLRDSADTDAVLGTAASYFETPDAAAGAATQLGTTPEAIRDSVDAHPLKGTNVLEVVGSDEDPPRAAQIANAVVQAGIAWRTQRFQAQLGAVLARIRNSPSQQAQAREVDLEAMQGRPDPTLEQLSSATAPTDPAWPEPELIIPAAVLGALGIAALVVLMPPLVASRRARKPAAPAVDENRERRLQEREEAVARREGGLQQRERELAKAVEAAKAATADQKRLDRRLAEVTRREQDMAKRAAELVRRERELADHEHELEAREEAPPTPPPPPPEPEPRPQPAPPRHPERAAAPGGWTIQELDRLVAEHGAEHPDRIDEWRYYVHFLREHSDVDGNLPATFDYLVEETFSELLS